MRDDDRQQAHAAIFATVVHIPPADLLELIRLHEVIGYANRHYGQSTQARANTGFHDAITKTVAGLSEFCINEMVDRLKG